MSDDFQIDQMPSPAQAVFDSTRAKLLFQSDVFRARASFGPRGIVELELPWFKPTTKCCSRNHALATSVESPGGLLEIQRREQEILEYLSRDLEQPMAS